LSNCLKYLVEIRDIIKSAFEAGLIDCFILLEKVAGHLNTVLVHKISEGAVHNLPEVITKGWNR